MNIQIMTKSTLLFVNLLAISKATVGRDMLGGVT